MIRLVIADRDEEYTRKLILFLATKHPGQFETIAFTDIELLEEHLENNKPHLLITTEDFEAVKKKKGENCGFAYLTAENTRKINNTEAICKYQKFEDIYSRIISIYSEVGVFDSSLEKEIGDTKIITFFGVSGGAGASTMAAACAANSARQGFKTLYLNLEVFSSTSCFFHGKGSGSFEDVIFALKSKKINFKLKAESALSTDDATGVYYFEPVQNFIDILDLDDGDIKSLMLNISAMEMFDIVVVDADFKLDDRTKVLIDISSRICLIGTGSEISNDKMECFIRDVRTFEEHMRSNLSGKMVAVYNQFRSQQGKMVVSDLIPNIGGAPRVEQSTPQERAIYISKIPFMDELVR